MSKDQFLATAGDVKLDSSNNLNRRDFFKLSLFAFWLTACNPNDLNESQGAIVSELQEPQFSTEPEIKTEPEGLPLSSEEYQALLQSGTVDNLIQDLYVDFRADHPEVEFGIEELFYSYLLSKDFRERTFYNFLRKTVTPDWLKKSGLLLGEDLYGVYHTKNVNNGLRFFDPKSNLYVKLVPLDSHCLPYFQDSYYAWQTTYNKVLNRPDLAQKIQFVSQGIKHNGIEYAALVTPKVGTITLENAISQKIITQEQASNLLFNYYQQVLKPMNKAGIYQPDPNFKNIMVELDKNKQIKNVYPIDFESAPKITNADFLLEGQYRELAARASKRGITMPDFMEIGEKPIPLYDPYGVQIKYGQQKLKVLVPNSLFTGKTTDQANQIIRTIEHEINQKMPKISRGDRFLIEVAIDGQKIPINLIKTACYSDEIVSKEYLKYLFKASKQGVKYVFDGLFLGLAAYEVYQLTVPQFRVDFQSGQAFPDNVLVSGQTEISTVLDASFEGLIKAKQSLVEGVGTLSGDKAKLCELIIGTSPDGLDELLKLAEPYHLGVPEVSNLLNRVANESMAPAPISLHFASPVPLLIDGEKMPLQGYVSAIEKEGSRLMVFSAIMPQEQPDSGFLMPVFSCFQAQEDKPWKLQSLTNEPWTMSFDLYDKKFQCNLAEINEKGSTLKLTCQQ